MHGRILLKSKLIETLKAQIPALFTVSGSVGWMQDFASEYVSRTKPPGGTKLRLIVDIDKVTTEYARQLTQANKGPGDEVANAADQLPAQLKATAE